MRRMLPVALALLGVAALASAVVRGEARVALVLFVPVVFGTGPLAFVGVLLLVAAVVAWMFTRRAPSEAEWNAQPARPQPPPETWADEHPVEERRTRWAAVGLVGPFPVGWGSDPGALRTALVVLAVLVGLAIVALLLLRAA